MCYADPSRMRVGRILSSSPLFLVFYTFKEIKSYNLLQETVKVENLLIDDDLETSITEFTGLPMEELNTSNYDNILAKTQTLTQKYSDIRYVYIFL